MHGFRAIGRDVEVSSGSHQRLPDMCAGIRRHIHLKRHFARKADAHDAGFHTGHRSGTPAHEWKSFVGQVHILADTPNHRTAFWSDHRKRGPLVRNGGHIDLHIRPFGLCPALQPAHHPGGATRGGGHQEMVFG